MLTYADLIEFEPPQSKILYLNNKTLILYGGDTTDHVSIWRSAFQGKGKNTDSMTTAQIADAYALEFRNFRAKRAEMQVLTPLGLTLKSYAAKRHQMSDYQLSELDRKLQESTRLLEVIIAGVDQTGAHIFTIVDPGVPACHDAFAFCAIGTGAYHARSQYMFLNYTKVWSWNDCVYATYAAKRRAETAPGVGRETVIVVVGGYETPIVVNNSEMVKLKTVYDEMANENDASFKQALQKLQN